jgi:demethylmenaquinone methyltransferase/2-methoxy-6-polyprenyl-1,4-benzoquinol methylase
MDPRAENARASAPSARKREALELFAGLPRRYDLLSAALSFGQDPRWRRALVDALAPEPGDRVLDVATGTGLVARELLERCDCSVVGIDQSEAMLARARARFGAGERARVELLQGEAEALPFANGSFDALTFTYLLRYVDDPPATLAELARVLRPGGRIASLEFGVPPGAAARAAWRLYTAIGLPLLGRVASREWARVGGFLGPSIRGFYEQHPLERIVEYWRAAGLADVEMRRMSLGGGVLMWARKRGDRRAGEGTGPPSNAARGEA